MGAETSAPVRQQPRLKRNDTHFCGLDNFGSTCYFNSVIEALFASPTFRQLVLTSEPQDDLAVAFQALYTEMCSTRSTTISPKDLFSKVNKLQPEWTYYQQQDAHELLNFLLNHMESQTASKQPHHEVVNELQQLSSKERRSYPLHSPPMSKTTSNGELVRLFEGLIRRGTSCVCCEHKSNSMEKFFDLPLDIIAETTLEKAILALERSEYLPTKSKIFCDNCQMLQQGIRSACLWHIPKICVFQLKRFRCKSGTLFKVNDKLLFPPTLYLKAPLKIDTHFPGHTLTEALKKIESSLINFPSHVDSTATAATSKQTLSLFAVICHIGSSLFAGHYVTVVRSSADTWCLIDDEDVIRLTPQQTQGFFAGSPNQLNGLLDIRNAYLLFYERY